MNHLFHHCRLKRWRYSVFWQSAPIVWWRRTSRSESWKISTTESVVLSSLLTTTLSSLRTLTMTEQVWILLNITDLNDFLRSFSPGPDAFFWVGTEGSPSNVSDEKTLILDPQGNNYQYRDQSAPVLGRSDGERMTLTLPSNMKVGDLKWISVWCRRFTVDFGNLIFPDNLDLPTSEKQLPHPLVPVDDNAVSEPEPEGESEPEPGRRRSETDPDIVFNAIICFRTRPRPRPPSRPRPPRPRPQ